MRKKLFMRRFPLSLCLFAIIFQGCTTIGARNLQGNRPAYNQAIQTTEKEELLLNIVRTRYGEPLKFTQVASIVSTFNYGAALNAGGQLPEKESLAVGLVDTYSIGGGVTYAEVPTVTYIPVEGAQFAAQILKESSVETMLNLIRGGWNIDQVMSLMVAGFGPLSNNPNSASSDKFVELGKLLGEIQARGDMKFVVVSKSDQILAKEVPPSAVNLEVFASDLAPALLLMPNPDNPESGTYQMNLIGISTAIELNYANEAEASRVASLLGNSSRQPGALTERLMLLDSAQLKPHLFFEPLTLVSTTMRSFSDQLVSLAGNINVPESDQNITVPFKPSKSKIMEIHQASSHPGNAFVAVKHKGNWFYIPEDDLTSKTTFSLLLSIYSLQTIGGGAAPSLSLPIGG